MYCLIGVLRVTGVGSERGSGGNITSGKCIAASSLAVGPPPPTVVGDATFYCIPVAFVS